MSSISLRAQRVPTKRSLSKAVAGLRRGPGGVDRSGPFEIDQLGIIGSEENAIIIGELQMPGSGSRARHGRDGLDGDELRAPNIETREGNGPTIGK